jgi:hypothetical protein
VLGIDIAAKHSPAFICSALCSRELQDNLPVLLTLRPKQLHAAAEESAYLIPATARLQPEY